MLTKQPYRVAGMRTKSNFANFVRLTARVGLSSTLVFAFACGAFSAEALATPLPALTGLHIKHYALDLLFDPSAKTVAGTVAINFTRAADVATRSLPINMAQTLQTRGATLTPRRLIRSTVSSLNSRLNVRFAICHLRFHHHT